MSREPIAELLRNRNLFIAIEGLDGAGKSTQVARFMDYLKRNDIDAVYTREVGGTPFAEQCRNLLLSAGNKGISDRSRALLISAARNDHIESFIKPALERGRTVITDRFFLSTIMYQNNVPTADQLKLVDFIGANVGGINPNIVFLFDVSYENYVKRDQSTDHLAVMTPEEFQRRKELMFKHPGYPDSVIIHINANLSREQVLMEMITKFHAVIGARVARKEIFAYVREADRNRITETEAIDLGYVRPHLMEAVKEYEQQYKDAKMTVDEQGVTADAEVNLRSALASLGDNVAPVSLSLETTAVAEQQEKALDPDAVALWGLLDDISTAFDLFRPDMTGFERYVALRCEKRNKYLQSPDGMGLVKSTVFAVDGESEPTAVVIADAINTFRRYEVHHRAKGGIADEKAEVNRLIAERLEKVLDRISDRTQPVVSFDPLTVSGTHRLLPVSLVELAAKHLTFFGQEYEHPSQPWLVARLERIVNGEPLFACREGYNAVHQESFACRHCGTKGLLEFREKDGDHEDYDYHCLACDKGWVSEGSDY